VQLLKDFCLPAVLELWGASLFKQVLPLDCEIFMKFNRTVHSFHIILNGGIFQDLGVVSKVFEVTEAVRVAADFLLLVHVPLIVVFLIKNEFVDRNRPVLVVFLESQLENVWLLFTEILGLQWLVCLDPLHHLGPHFVEVLVGNFF